MYALETNANITQTHLDSHPTHARTPTLPNTHHAHTTPNRNHTAATPCKHTMQCISGGLSALDLQMVELTRLHTGGDLGLVHDYAYEPARHVKGTTGLEPQRHSVALGGLTDGSSTAPSPSRSSSIARASASYERVCLSLHTGHAAALRQSPRVPASI